MDSVGREWQTEVGCYREGKTKKRENQTERKGGREVKVRESEKQRKKQACYWNQILQGECASAKSSANIYTWHTQIQNKSAIWIR